MDDNSDDTPISSIPLPVLKLRPEWKEDLEYRVVGKRLYLTDAHGRVVIDFTEDLLP